MSSERPRDEVSDEKVSGILDQEFGDRVYAVEEGVVWGERDEQPLQFDRPPKGPNPRPHARRPYQPRLR